MGLFEKIIGAGAVVGGAAIAAVSLLGGKDKKLKELDVAFEQEKHRYETKKTDLMDKIARGDRNAQKKLSDLESKFRIAQIEYESERKKYLPKDTKGKDIVQPQQISTPTVQPQTVYVQQSQLQESYSQVPLYERERALAKQSQIQSTSHHSGSAFVNCPACRTVNSGKSKFCRGCGASVVENTKFCIHCGAKINADSIFCTECGGSIE